MEALYSKLFDKYTRLKANKASEIEQYNFDQEQSFKNYVSAADEYISHLENEKAMLYTQNSELRQELISIRSAKDEEQTKYEDLLLKENLKNKELSEEIERLNKREIHSNNNNEIVPIKQVSSSPFSSGKSNNKSTMRKRRRVSIYENEVDVAPAGDDQLENEPQKDLDEEKMFWDANQPKCCRRKLVNSANGTDSSICMFQELVESLLDLKFSVETQNDLPMTVVHDSSGYTFNIGWVKTSAGEEEILYKVSSLGTFERVAPPWMRDMILFQKSMIRIFFEKVSNIMKLQQL